MFTELPIATATVIFPNYPKINEKQILGLVQAVAGVDFIFRERFFDGPVYEIGRAPEDAHRHIRVVPALEGLPYFRPSDHREHQRANVYVMSHDWPERGSFYHEDIANEEILHSVNSFAELLEQAYDHACAVSEWPTFQVSPRLATRKG